MCIIIIRKVSTYEQEIKTTCLRDFCDFKISIKKEYIVSQINIIEKEKKLKKNIPLHSFNLLFLNKNKRSVTLEKIALSGCIFTC